MRTVNRDAGGCLVVIVITIHLDNNLLSTNMCEISSSKLRLLEQTPQTQTDSGVDGMQGLDTVIAQTPGIWNVGI